MRMLLQYGRSEARNSGGRNQSASNFGSEMRGARGMGGQSKAGPMRMGSFSRQGGDFDPVLIEEACERIEEKLQTPPRTWERFLEADRILPIIKMEYAELQRAVREVKQGQREPHEIERELIHLAAALVAAHVELCEDRNA